MCDEDMTIAEKIAEFISDLRYESIPSDVIERAKYQLLSALGAVYAGREFPNAKAVAEVCRRKKGNATLLPYGLKTTPEFAAFGNACFSMAFDYDSYLFMAHTDHSACLVPLAFCESEALPGKDLLLAQIAANEVGGRAGASVVIGPRNGQMWANVHSLATIAALSKIHEVDYDTAVNAVGLQFYMPLHSLVPGFMGSHAKILTAAYPILTSVTSMKLAAGGLKGRRNILEEKRGFLDHFSFFPLPEMFTGFSKAWVTKTLAYKIHPGCAYVSAVIDCMERLGCSKGEVDEIEVQTNLLSLGMEAMQRPYITRSPVSVNFSIVLSIATYLANGTLTTEVLSEEKLAEKWSEIVAISKKIKLSHNPKLTFELLSNWLKSLPLENLGLVKKPSIIDALLAGRRMMTNCPELRSYVFNFGTVFEGARALIPIFMNKSMNKLRRGFGKEFSLEDADLDSIEWIFGSGVRVKLRDGRMLEAFQKIPKGAEKGEKWNETKKLVEKKFVDEVGKRIGENRAREAMRLILSIDKVTDIRDLIDVLSPRH
jgi:2-methylcitrate dehydratase PrpD